jgi:hypothetical protein
MIRANAPKPVARVREIRLATMYEFRAANFHRLLDILRQFVRRFEMIVPQQDRRAG